jgi:hypothetical protein
MLRLFIILSFFIFHQIDAQAQFDEKFNTSLEEWSGTNENFIITADNQLQLMALEAGTSQLYRNITYADSLVFELYIKMDFSPSSNNKLRWYLWSDQVNLDVSDGYYIEIGENGSNDAVKFYTRQNGLESLLGSGEAGKASNNPELFIKIILLSASKWEVQIDYSGSKFPLTEFTIDEQFNTAGTNGFHGLSLFYTSSRTEDFIFDDWVVKKFEADTVSPLLLSTEVVNSSTIQLVFDELILESSISIASFNTFPSLGSIIEYALNKNILTLTFDVLPSDQFFSLLIQGLSDLNGNILEAITVENLLYASPPNLGDLVLSEILFNPKGNESDYVEVFNTTNKFLDLSEIEIHNFNNGQSSKIGQDLYIYPGEYIAFSENISETNMRFIPPDSATLIELDLPSFNNEDGNVSLLYQGVTFDTYDYHADHHNPVINDPDGVSLERISYTSNSNISTNWTSAASTVNYGSPGYKNSASIINLLSIVEFSVRSSSFSPNNDGLNDKLIIDYNLDKPGYVGSVTIYTENGQLIKTLTNNEILSSNGFLFWSGEDNEDLPARVGVYIVVVNLFHPDGETKKYKMAASLNRSLR